jgi:hypothetical protein
MSVVIPLCNHIKPDGIRCGSPALRGQRRCYFHNRKNVVRRKPTTMAAAFTALTDRQSISHALTATVQGLITGELQAKEAGVLLYALQIASGKLAG